MVDGKNERFNGSIDDKNRQLLDLLEKEGGVQIEFEIRPEKEYWAVRPKPRYVIASPNEESAPTMLAHELLHIMIDILGFVPTYVIVKVFTNKNCRFDTSHLPEWENLLGHCKMIRHFKGLGYEGSQFTSHDENKFHSGELLPLTGLFEEKFKFYKSNNIDIPSDLITHFLGVLIAVKEYELQYDGDEKRPLDPELYYNGLRNCDTSLFDALKGELDAWIREEGNYSNVDFYMKINLALEKLGYPIVEP